MAIAAMRLPTGNIVAFDRNQRAVVLSESGTELLKTHRFDVNRIEDVEPLDDSRFLMAGTSTEAVGQWLHIWSLEKDSIITQFFDPFEGSLPGVLANTSGWSSASVLGDTIAATFSTIDSVYFFDRRGRPLGSKVIPFVGFRQPTPPPVAVQSSARARSEWVQSFDLVSGPHWIDTEHLAIAYQSFGPGMEPRHHLLVMNVNGGLIVDVREVPRLLRADPSNATLYFVASTSDAPNRISKATFEVQ